MTTAAKPLPSDPVFSGSLDWCVYWHADEGIEGSVREATRTTRAAAQSYFAREIGVDFATVRCRTTYGRVLTRQEVWDEYGGSERWADDRLEELGLDVKHDPSAPAGSADAFYYEDEDGRRVPESELEPPAEPPADWEPSDDDPVWTVCKKDEPGAIKIYICEERSA